MLCEPKASVDVVQVAAAVPAEPLTASACAEQPGIATPVTLSMKATDPVSGRPPEGYVSVAVKVTEALTAETGCEETKTRLVAAPPTVSCGDSVPVLEL
jgi:hypothetical protein